MSDEADANGWMPAATRPEESGDYNVWFPANHYHGYAPKATTARWNGHCWTDAGYRTDDGDVPTHWQPLPGPPVQP